jgi:S1-C subfamily serine protease
MFPNDGIHTRMIVFVNPDSKLQAKFIETSTPGLRGQSGGPLFDASGRIWGIQSHTDHLELGFSPKILKDKKMVEVKEHQFLHVGRATHVQHVIDIFNERGVRYDSA